MSPIITPEDPEIISIMPANGWSAKYTERGAQIVVPLVCWALIKRNGSHEVVGMDPYVSGVVSISEDCDFFDKYLPPVTV